MSETPTCPFVIYIFYTAAACREHRSKAFPHAGAFRPMRRGNVARVSALCSAGLNYKHSAFLVNYKARVCWVHPLTRQRCLERRGAWSASAGGSRAGVWRGLMSLGARWRSAGEAAVCEPSSLPQAGFGSLQGRRQGSESRSRETFRALVSKLAHDSLLSATESRKASPGPRGGERGAVS